MEEYSTELEEAGSGGQLEGRNSTVSSPPDVDYSYYVYGLVALGGFSRLCTCVLAIQVAVLCTRNRQAGKSKCIILHMKVICTVALHMDMLHDFLHAHHTTFPCMPHDLPMDATRPSHGRHTTFPCTSYHTRHTTIFHMHVTLAVELELGTYGYSKMNRNKQPPSSTT